MNFLFRNIEADYLKTCLEDNLISTVHSARCFWGAKGLELHDPAEESAGNGINYGKDSQKLFSDLIKTICDVDVNILIVRRTLKEFCTFFCSPNCPLSLRNYPDS